MNIEVLSAGAGSGKTYTLTGRMVKLLDGQIRPSGIIATTFTKKAAAELQDRVRVRLLEEGLTEAANDLGSALIGTVHGVGVKLLQRFAFEAGVSPLVEIIADGDEQRLFNESLSQVLTEAKIVQFTYLADRLGFTKKQLTGESFDWRKSIRELTDVARANNFSIETLQKSKALSWQTFARFLPTPKEIDQITWTNRLKFHLDQTIVALENNENDSTKVTRDLVIELRNLQNQLNWRGELYWYEWVKISKLKVGAKSRDLFAELQEFVLSHDENRQFQEDIKNFLDLMFDVVIEALSEFEAYKKKRGLIDYTDMETYVSRLLRVEAVREVLRAELDLLLVDEFQDTSPIQLDIFLQMSALAKRSIWVGDPKQSIYGFRGADPALMQAIIDQTGGVKPENILQNSWRSRADVVNAVNAIFVRAFPDTPPDQVALNPVRTKDKEPENTPLALMQWVFKNELDEKKEPAAPWLENCIATQIQTLIEQQLPVQPKGSKEWRPVQPGDIAILCRSNIACNTMAEALHRAGIKAAIARNGLLETPEAKLVLACLKCLLSPSDALSVAEIRRLASAEPLEQIVDDRLTYLERLREAEPDSPRAERWSSNNDVVSRLHELRPRTADLSASEILNLLLDDLDLRRTVIRFGNPAQRLDNVDMLRSYALDYESACTRLHSAASLGGFLLWLANLSTEKKDMQGSGESPDAVKVLTYHKSKGLEYPVTICHGLKGDLKERVWGINLVPESDTIDLNDILGGRWLRFWVNPYADQEKGTRLLEALQVSPEWAAANKHALAEEARLMYVGLTRARDYLVFPSTIKPLKWLNRVFNKGDETIPTLDPYSDETPFYWNDAVIKIQTDNIYREKDFAEAHIEEPAARFHDNRSGKRAYFPYKIDPLAEVPPGFEPKFKEAEWWTTLPANFATLNETQQVSLQKALHAVLLADNLRYPSPERLDITKLQLQIRELPTDNIRPEDVSKISESFFYFLKNRFAPKKLDRKMPFRYFFQDRLVEIEADFLLETDTEVIVGQMAPCAEGKKDLKKTAQNMAPLLAWFKMGCQRAFPNKTVVSGVIFPSEGAFLEVLTQ